jgi:hypothetical protein
MNFVTIERLDLEKAEGWRDMVDKIPYLRLGPSIVVRPVPPVGGAVCRLNLGLLDDRGEMGEEWVSVYLDWFGVLACMDEPYWEVYPNEFGENERFDLDDARGVARCIRSSLYSQRENNK